MKDIRRWSGVSKRRRSRCQPGLEGLERRDVPAVFNVNSLADTLSPPTGALTLRLALQEAASAPGGNTINLTVGGTYAISSGNGAFTIPATGGNLTIVNTSNQEVAIDGGKASRVFDIDPADTPTAISVTFQGFTIQNGVATATGSANSGSGGGIRVNGPISLTLNGVTLINDSAATAGGGLFMGSTSGTDAWALTLNNSTVYNDAVNNAITGVGGGGISASGGVSDSVTINSSQFTGNSTTGAGGALYVGPSVTNALLINSSTFSNNSASKNGGAIEFLGGGLIVNGTSSIFTNCTFVGDSSSTSGGAIADDGVGDIGYVNDTINGNKASANGGGIFDSPSNTNHQTFLNTIVAQNTATTAGPDVYDQASVTDSTGNLIGTVNQGNTGFTSASQLTGSLSLGPLQNNGGPVVGSSSNAIVLQTEAPLSGSPAIGGGYVVPGSPSQDERGYARSTTTGARITSGALAPQSMVAASRPFVVQVSDNQVYSQAYGGSTGTFTGPYILTAAKPVEDMQAVKLGNGTYMVFVIGTDNQVYDETIAASGTTSNGYQLAAYGSVRSIAAGTDAGGNPVFFAVGTDNQLYEQTLNLNGTPASDSYTKAAYGAFSQVQLTHDYFGNPLLYATGQDSQVYGLQLTAGGTPAAPLFKMAIGTVKQLAVGHTANNVPELFVVGTDNYVYTLYANANGTPASGYNFVGGPVTAIAPASTGSNNPELFVIGTDGRAYAQMFNANGTPTGKFIGLPTPTGGLTALAAGSNTVGNPVLYAIAMGDSQVYAMPFNAAGNSTGSFALTATGTVRKVVLA